MFRDRDRFSAQFIESDLLHPSEQLAALGASIDVLSMMYVLHQWDWDTQVAALRQLVGFSRPGATVIGIQCGSRGEHERPVTKIAQSPTYWHDPDSFRTLWERVGELTGTEWVVSEVRFREWEELGKDAKESRWLGEEVRMLQWVADRVK